jgi:hypothetical protein
MHRGFILSLWRSSGDGLLSLHDPVTQKEDSAMAQPRTERFAHVDVAPAGIMTAWFNDLRLSDDDIRKARRWLLVTRSSRSSAAQRRSSSHRWPR